jgi:hypothetical protein
VSTNNLKYRKTKASKNRIAPACYCYYCKKISTEKYHSGTGYISNTEAFYAEAILSVTEQIITEFEGEFDFSLDIVLKKDGTKNYLQTFSWDWKRNGDRNSDGFRPNNYETWERLLALSSIGNMQIRKAENAEEMVFLDNLSGYARQKAKSLPDVSDDAEEGVQLRESIQWL